MACPLASDTAVPTVRQWVRRFTSAPNMVVVKLDFESAFNTLGREVALRELESAFPELARWVRWCYGQDSHLSFGRIEISSEAGVQQGEPLGPLMFACAIHSTVRWAANIMRQHATDGRSKLTLVYLDDGLLCGSVEGSHRGVSRHPARCASAGARPQPRQV